MSQFAGIVRFDGQPIDVADAARLTNALRGVGKARLWRTAMVVLAERRDDRFYDNGSPAPPPQSRDDVFLLASARLDAPGEVASALGRGAGQARDDRSLLVAACERWGTASAAERLYGDFAVAEWDEGARRLTLARDAIGVRPIYYVERPWGVLFATTLQVLLTLPDVPRDLDEEVIAHTLTLTLQDQERTPYRHIRRAPPGGVMTFDRRGSTSRRYFTAETIRPVRFARDQDYVDATRGALDAAVACRIPAEGRVAAMLSGGFDSAAVVATAARLMGDRPLHAITRVPGFAHPYPHGDERALAGALAAMYPNIDWQVIDDQAALVAEIDPEADLGAICVPRTSSFNIAWFDSVLDSLRASAADVILGGRAGNFTLSYTGEPDFGARLRTANAGGALADLRSIATHSGRSIARTAAGVAYRQLMPRAGRRWATQRRAGAAPWLGFSLVSPAFLDELDYAPLAEARGHDIPFDSPYVGIDRRLRMLQGQRGRDFGGFVRRKGHPIDPRSPLADRAFVELTLGMPEDQYWRDGTRRWLAKRVLADRVPPETLAQTRNAKQSADWYAVATFHHQAMRAAIERIGRSRLAARVLDIPRMHQLLDSWPVDAEAARAHERLHGHALQRAIAMGGFLRWYEGGNA